MHGAAILKPDLSASRIINSTLIASASYEMEDASSKVAEFLRADKISGQL